MFLAPKYSLIGDFVFLCMAVATEIITKSIWVDIGRERGEREEGGWVEKAEVGENPVSAGLMVSPRCLYYTVWSYLSKMLFNGKWEYGCLQMRHPRRLKCICSLSFAWLKASIAWQELTMQLWLWAYHLKNAANRTKVEEGFAANSIQILCALNRIWTKTSWHFIVQREASSQNMQRLQTPQCFVKQLESQYSWWDVGMTTAATYLKHIK